MVGYVSDTQRLHKGLGSIQHREEKKKQGKKKEGGRRRVES